MSTYRTQETTAESQSRTKIRIDIRQRPDDPERFDLVIPHNDQGKGVSIDPSDTHSILVEPVGSDPSNYILQFKIEVTGWAFGDPALIWFPPPQKHTDFSGNPLGTRPVNPQSKQVAELPVNPKDVTERCQFDFFLFIIDAKNTEGQKETVLVRPSSGPFKDPTIVLSPPGG